MWDLIAGRGAARERGRAKKGALPTVSSPEQEKTLALKVARRGVEPGKKITTKHRIVFFYNKTLASHFFRF